jgi:membrane protein DedA with SNARE-associated domain
MFDIKEIEMLLRAFATSMPLGAFSFFGSLLEEVVSPIPSYLIMGIVGTLAFAQKISFAGLLLLVVIGSLGKTIGAAFYYFIGDKLEDLLRNSLGRFFSVRPETIENFGKRFTGKHWKDGGVIFLLRLFPITPTTPVSIACGIFKIRFDVYFLATYLGYFFKDLVYILLGYYGVASVGKLWKEVHWYKVEIEWILALMAFGAFLTFFFQSAIWKDWRAAYRDYKNSHRNYL